MIPTAVRLPLLDAIVVLLLGQFVVADLLPRGSLTFLLAISRLAPSKYLDLEAQITIPALIEHGQTGLWRKEERSSFRSKLKTKMKAPGHRLLLQKVRTMLYRRARLWAEGISGAFFP